MNAIFGTKSKNKKEDKNRSAKGENRAIVDLAIEIEANNLKNPDLQEILKKTDAELNMMQAENENPAKAVSKTRPERRRKGRASAKVLVRIRPADSNAPKFEEVLGTSNASRANMYVVTTSNNYYKLMRLRVTFPFDSAHDDDSSHEESAEVVRLDHLPNGRTGIAIQLERSIHSPARFAAAPAISFERPPSEHRFTVRHPFSASATLIDTNSNTRLQARCSDLSVAGCYIDTLNPFPKGTRALLQLTYQDVNFVALAQVVTHHVGMGMGIAFERLEPTQRSILADWLCSRVATPSLSAEELQASMPAEPSESEESSDRAILLRMIRLLKSNGKLAPL
jgi:PilZ domain